MTKVVDVAEAQSHLKWLLALARNGDEVIIEESGESPVQLKLVADRSRGPLKLGLREGQGSTSDDFDDDLPDSFWLGEGK